MATRPSTSARNWPNRYSRSIGPEVSGAAVALPLPTIRGCGGVKAGWRSGRLLANRAGATAGTVCGDVPPRMKSFTPFIQLFMSSGHWPVLLVTYSQPLLDPRPDALARTRVQPERHKTVNRAQKPGNNRGDSG